MFLISLLINRLSKFFGLLIKGFCYVFHYFFPRKRFVIPKNSRPILGYKNKNKISKIIWQTNFTNRVTLPLYINYLFNRLMSLSYEYRFCSHEDRLDFINSNTSKKISSAYSRLNDGAAQADLWRLLVLYHFGGVYIDIDGTLVCPLSRMIKKNDSEIFLQNKCGYTNYFLAVKKITLF